MSMTKAELKVDVRSKFLTTLVTLIFFYNVNANSVLEFSFKIQRKWQKIED